MRFAWDSAKEKDNLARHGVDFTSPQEAFRDPCALVLYDDAHSTDSELRWWLLGRVGPRILLVRYTHRPDGVIRLIGAGFWREGRHHYENHWKQNPRPDL